MRGGLPTGRLGIDREGSLQVRLFGTAGRITLCLVCCLLQGFLWLAVASASGGGGSESEGGSWLNFLWRMVNFIVLIGVLSWLIGKKVKDYFAGRREEIKKALDEAASARAEAEKKFQEYTAKLDKATGEIEQIGAMIESQGVAEKTRIIEDARKAAEKIKEDTQARMDQEFAKAAQELRTEAIRLSTQMAEELLKQNVKPTDHETMVKDYIEKVVTKH